MKPLQKFRQEQSRPWCGKFPGHDHQQCPAREVECRKCGKNGHFQHVCRSGAKQVSFVASEGGAFLGGVNALKSNPWTVDLHLNDEVSCRYRS